MMMTMMMMTITHGDDDDRYSDNDDEVSLTGCRASHPYEIRIRSCPKFKSSIPISMST